MQLLIPHGLASGVFGDLHVMGLLQPRARVRGYRHANATPHGPSVLVLPGQVVTAVHEAVLEHTEPCLNPWVGLGQAEFGMVHDLALGAN